MRLARGLPPSPRERGGRGSQIDRERESGQASVSCAASEFEAVRLCWRCAQRAWLPRENVCVPETDAERSARVRAAARRRECATLLQISASTCTYGAVQLGNGISPDEARQTALFVAGELVGMAAALYRLARLRPADRAVLARLMVGAGMTRREAAVRLGVSERTVRYYLSRPR